MTLDNTVSDGEGWGVRFSPEPSSSKRGLIPAGCPRWATPGQVTEWQQQGVVVWQRATRRIAAISAHDALVFLQTLRTTTEWQVEGLTLTEQHERVTLPQTSRPRRTKKGEAQPDPPAEKAKRERVTEEIMRLSPEHARELLVVLERNEVDLRRMAEADKRRRSEALLNVYRMLLESHREREATDFDWAGRPVEWIRDGTRHRWVCERMGNRAVVNFAEAGWHWEACVAEPPADSPGFETFVHLAQAVSWAEEQLLAAEQQPAAQKKVAASASAAAYGGSTVDLGPYRIDPAALEPDRLTYRLFIELDVAPDRYKVMELHCGRQLRYDERYATPWQLAAELGIDDAEYEFGHPLGPNDGWNRARSSVTYYQQALAIEQAQAAWNKSRIVERFREGKVLRARCGIQEVETGFVLWLGSLAPSEDPWPAPESRAEYLASQAEELTLAHALDVASFRGFLGLGAEPSDDKLLGALHKRRARSPAIPEPARAESRRWLATARR